MEYCIASRLAEASLCKHLFLTGWCLWRQSCCAVFSLSRQSCGVGENFPIQAGNSEYTLHYHVSLWGGVCVCTRDVLTQTTRLSRWVKWSPQLLQLHWGPREQWAMDPRPLLLTLVQSLTHTHDHKQTLHTHCLSHHQLNRCARSHRFHS